MKHLTNTFVATVGIASPRTAKYLVKGLDDRERGEVTVATVIWAAFAITLAVGAGVVLYGAVTKKATKVDSDLNTVDIKNP